MDVQQVCLTAVRAQNRIDHHSTFRGKPRIAQKPQGAPAAIPLSAGRRAILINPAPLFRGAVLAPLVPRLRDFSDFNKLATHGAVSALTSRYKLNGALGHPTHPSSIVIARARRIGEKLLFYVVHLLDCFPCPFFLLATSNPDLAGRLCHGRLVVRLLPVECPAAGSRRRTGFESALLSVRKVEVGTRQRAHQIHGLVDHSTSTRPRCSSPISPAMLVCDTVGSGFF